MSNDYVGRNVLDTSLQPL